MMVPLALNAQTLTIEVTPDNYPEEFSMAVYTPDELLLTVSTGDNADQDTVITYTVDIPTETCFTVQLNDSFGDGNCCSWGDGNVVVVFDGDTLHTGGDYGTSFLIEGGNCPTIEDLQAQIAELEADLAECDSVAQAEVEYWMNNYYDAVAEGNALVDSLNAIISAVPATIAAIVDPLNAELEAAQECCSSCPAAIETAVDNAVESALDEANLLCAELMTENYNTGYADGLEDCEGEVSGLVDIDGTVINVIGYYNQLGQVIDPATATGVIIRKHEDGTFSKYFR